MALPVLAGFCENEPAVLSHKTQPDPVEPKKLDTAEASL
jgi:hypothetical protein